MRCKKYWKPLCGLLFALLYLSSPLEIKAQEDEGGPPLYFLLGSDYLKWIDDRERVHVTLDFPGQDMRPGGVDVSFTIDSTYFYQVLKREYSSDQYTNQADTLKEQELLKYYQKYEVDYLADEIFEAELEVTEELLINSEGKKFNLYYFPDPTYEDKEKEEDHSYPTHHIYLEFIANDYVYAIYTIVLDTKDDLETRIATVKGIAESAEIYGGPISLGYLSEKVKLDDPDEEVLELVEEEFGYVLEIPTWLNVCESPRTNIFIATFPDIWNVKNAVAITAFDKEDFDSFDDFSTQKVSGHKMGDTVGRGTVLIKNELEAPENSEGVAYKMQTMGGNSMYEVQFVTYETETAYLLVNFTATPNTYDRNVGRFREFLEGLSFDLEEIEEEGED